MPEIGQIRFSKKFDTAYEKGSPPNLNRSPLSKFELKVQEFQSQVKEDTRSNNEYFTLPNPIIQSYRELPPNTGLAYGPAAAAATASLAKPPLLYSQASAASLH